MKKWYINEHLTHWLLKGSVAITVAADTLTVVAVTLTATAVTLTVAAVMLTAAAVHLWQTKQVFKRATGVHHEPLFPLLICMITKRIIVSFTYLKFEQHLIDEILQCIHWFISVDLERSLTFKKNVKFYLMKKSAGLPCQVADHDAKSFDMASNHVGNVTAKNSLKSLQSESIFAMKIMNVYHSSFSTTCIHTTVMS